MIQSIDIYNDARRKFDPLDSIRYTIVDAVKNDIRLDFHVMAASLNRTARVLKMSIEDLVNDCPPDKAIMINQQIGLASAYLAKYISWDVVNKFIAEETLATGRWVPHERLFDSIGLPSP